MADSFPALLNKQRPDIEKLLASWITPERFFAMAMQIERIPELRNCTTESLVQCVIQAAQMGLEIGDTRGHMYVIPYGKDAQAQPGWRGLAFLRLRAGAIMQVDTEVVFKFERLNISRSNSSTGDVFLHEMDLFGDRTEKNAVGAYARVKLPDGEQQFEVISAERIQRHRQHSKQPNGLLWTKFWEEGWRKTPWRILDKRLPEGVNAEAIERYNAARSIETSSYRVDPDAAPDDPPRPVVAVPDVEVTAGSERASAPKGDRPLPVGAASRSGGADDPKLDEDEQDLIIKRYRQLKIPGEEWGEVVYTFAQTNCPNVHGIEDLPSSLLAAYLKHVEQFAEARAAQ